MKAMGIVNDSCLLSDKASDWETVDHKKWEIRLMQTYAAMISIMDEGVGKIINELKNKDLLENTLILFLHDNGGCSEGIGRQNKTYKQKILSKHNNDWIQTRGREVTRDGRLVRTGSNAMPGPEDTFIAYGRSWANVSNTPFKEYKQYVHEGGISTPLIAYWPKFISEKNGIRRSPGHVIDIMATCVELSGHKYPSTFHGHKIIPYEGKSLLKLFKSDKSEERVLLFEHLGNAAIRVGKWKLVGKKRFIGNLIKNEGWELYDLDTDRSEMNDLSWKYPNKVYELLSLFEKEAKRTFILPKKQMNVK